MTNKEIGNGFEAEFCAMLFSNGFWVHNFAQNQSGQPADVIGVRNGRAHLIDCKVCSKKGFKLDRMEENQDLSMTLWKNTGNGVGWFAIKTYEKEVYMFSHRVITQMIYDETSTISNENIKRIGIPFEKWVELCE